MLNEPRYEARRSCSRARNFGCGSSREHAPWALHDYGFRALIAPSFADIFYNNCYKNGLLPIVLPEREVDRLFDERRRFRASSSSIDLEQQTRHDARRRRSRSRSTSSRSASTAC